MKSIKEKAEECSLVREYVDSCGNFIRENSRVKQEQFTLGANYVLEEIEKCVKSSSNSRLKIDTIKQIIEQLKSNQ